MNLPNIPAPVARGLFAAGVVALAFLGLSKLKGKRLFVFGEKKKAAAAPLPAASEEPVEQPHPKADAPDETRGEAAAS